MRIKDDRILLKATRFIGSRKFGEAIRLLEPEVVRYHDSFRYYYLLAIACLRSGDFGGALTYFRRAREIKMREPSVLLGLAVLHLRRGETDRAVELYLETLEKDPKNRRAKKALQVIRKRGDPEALAAYLETGKVEALYPPTPTAPLSFAAAALYAAAAAAVIAAGIYAASFAGLIDLPKKPLPSRQGIDGVVLETAERQEAVEIGGTYRYVLTKKAVLAEFEEARKLFLDYRDEAARLSINRILESNASVAVKQKARLLAEHAVVPGFDTLKDLYAYSAVVKEPPLYRDVHVIWRGMATNLREGDKSTDFDLLVGYDTRSALEGIVPVRFEFAAQVDVERPLEVLGRVVVNGDKIRLVGLAIHQASSRGSK
jgi:tetratricopeptide (TPR) repeat protein